MVSLWKPKKNDSPKPAVAHGRVGERACGRWVHAGGGAFQGVDARWGGSLLKMAEPATNMSAPASAISLMFAGVTPPSTCYRVETDE